MTTEDELAEALSQLQLAHNRALVPCACCRAQLHEARRAVIVAAQAVARVRPSISSHLREALNEGDTESGKLAAIRVIYIVHPKHASSAVAFTPLFFDS